VLFRWTIESVKLDNGHRLNELVANACWGCATRGMSPCPIVNTRLAEAEDVSEYSPSETEAEPDEGAADEVRVPPVSQSIDRSDVSVNDGSLHEAPAIHRSGLTRSRTASQAGFPDSESKRQDVHEEQVDDEPHEVPLATSVYTETRRPSHVYRKRYFDRSNSSVPPSVSLPSLSEVYEELGQVSAPRVAVAIGDSGSTGGAATGTPSEQRLNSVSLLVDPVTATSLSDMKVKIETVFTSTVDAAQKHLDQMKVSSAHIHDTIQSLFTLCRTYEDQARADRDALNDINAERDRLIANLRTMDSRLAGYASIVEQKDKDLRSLETRTQYLVNQLENTRQEQAVVDQRMTAAVLERDKHSLDAKAAHFLTRAAEKRTADAEEALEDAFLEIDELSHRLAQAQGVQVLPPGSVTRKLPPTTPTRLPVLAGRRAVSEAPSPMTRPSQVATGTPGERRSTLRPLKLAQPATPRPPKPAVNAESSTMTIAKAPGTPGTARRPTTRRSVTPGKPSAPQTARASSIPQIPPPLPVGSSAALHTRPLVHSAPVGHVPVSIISPAVLLPDAMNITYTPNNLVPHSSSRLATVVASANPTVPNDTSAHVFQPQQYPAPSATEGHRTPARSSAQPDHAVLRRSP